MSEKPGVGRPHMPSSYGIKAPSADDPLLEWGTIDAQMESAHNYWIASASPDGRPHAAPVWGLWRRETFYFSTDPNSRKGKNMAANGWVVVHLESGDEAVIVEGHAEKVTGEALLDELDDLYYRKYGYHLERDATYQVKPEKVLAWQEGDFSGTATRWRFTA